MSRTLKPTRVAPEQSELDFASTSEIVPSPKRNPQKTRDRKHLPWETNYAAFSSAFALSAVRNLNADKKARIFDPFVGNGTTLEAALTSDMDSYGIELNPYSALLSRCRVATEVDFELVTDLLTRASKSRRKVLQSDSESLPGDSKAIIDTLMNLLSKRLECSSEKLIAILCAKGDGKFDSEVVALVAALDTLKKRARVHRRSNPAWLIKGESPDGQISDPQSWRSAALDIAESMSEDLLLRHRKRKSARTVGIFSGAFQKAPVRAGKIDCFLTSPPYLNRLDYVNPTLPELHGIGLDDDSVIESLRSEMMGTTKMRSPIEKSLPSKTVVNLFKEIAAHPTKASATYYLRFFQQYFYDFFDFLVWLDKHSTTGCKGMLVLQDSFYKNIKVPIVQIVQELAGGANFKVSIAHEESRSRHMGSISPHQRSHAPAKSLTEYTLLFERAF